MTRDELRLAAYLLRMAADDFCNHGCNDMPDEAFACISDESKAAMLARFNEWNGSADDPIEHPGDSGWMHHLSALLLLEAETLGAPSPRLYGGAK